MQSHGIFTPRKCDFRKKTKQNKPLTKNGDRLKKTDAPRFAGAGSYGPFNINSNKGFLPALYYISNHRHLEYFATEILQLIGINTPKIRIIDGKIPGITTQKNNEIFANVASKGVHEYIPMCHINGKRKPNSNNADPYEPRNRYTLRIESQTVFDNIDKKEYRISGNTYACYIGALLIRDIDFKEQQENFGLIRIGNRFYHMAIDKDLVNFNGKEHDCLRWNDSKFKRYCEQDQTLNVAYAILKALEKDQDGLCDIDRIFQHNRVLATPELLHRVDKYLANIKTTAQSIVNIFIRRDESIFETFLQREKYRANIACKVTSQLKLPKNVEVEAQELEQLIIEDLRGPFYKEFFADGKQISDKDCESDDLLVQITKDFASELELEAEQKRSYPRCSSFG